MNVALAKSGGLLRKAVETFCAEEAYRLLAMDQVASIVDANDPEVRVAQVLAKGLTVRKLWFRNFDSILYGVRCTRFGTSCVHHA